MKEASLASFYPVLLLWKDFLMWSAKNSLPEQRQGFLLSKKLMKFFLAQYLRDILCFAFDIRATFTILFPPILFVHYMLLLK